MTPEPATDDSPAPIVDMEMLQLIRQALEALLKMRCDPEDPAWRRAVLGVGIYSQCNGCPDGWPGQPCAITGGGMHLPRLRRSRRQGHLRAQDMEAAERLACECGIVASDGHSGTPCAAKACQTS